MSRIFWIVLLTTCLFTCHANAGAQTGELTQLTDDRYLNGYAEWSPDSSFIVFTSAREVYHLWRVSPEGGSEPVKVSEHNGHHARISPDGKYIVYDGDKGTVVRIMPTDGGVPIRVVPESIPIERSSNPVWSPDGEKIAFRSLHTIYVLDLASGEFSKVYHNEARIPLPLYWLKNENRLLVSLINREDNTAQVWKIPVDIGGDGDGVAESPIQLTFTPRVTQASPSPDESCLVYSSVGEGQTAANAQWDLWVMPMAGGKSIKLTNGEGQNWEPRWSPDGTRIVFTSTRNGAPDLYVMDVDLERIKAELGSLTER